MYKKATIFFLVIISLSFFRFASAAVIINEVKLLPTSERFIELYNNGSSSVDLTNWLMQRKTLTGSSFGSLVTSSNFAGKSIGPNDFFVISRTQLENSDLVVSTLTLTESNTIQIKISGESEIIDKIGWGDVTDCMSPCPPNPAEGQSLQRLSGGSWVVAAPTVGQANESAPPPPDSDDETPEDSSSSLGGGGAPPANQIPKKVEIKKIKTQIMAKTTALAGAPLSFESKTSGYAGEELYGGKYFWNFGDGDSKEMKNGESPKFNHTYFYPGEYSVSLEYYMNYYSSTPEATDTLMVKVISADVAISAVGDEKDFFVELTNNTGYDADISNWVLSGNGKSFIFAKNTTLGPKKKITISSRITGFSALDKDSLKLSTPEGNLAFDYANSITTIPPKIINKTTSRILPASLEKQPEPEAGEKITGEDLASSAIASDITEDNSFAGYVPSAAFAIILCASAYAVHFIRKKKNISGAGDDFQILDE